ncbi:hypothetical protein LTR97_010363 [Elasticomyces elasticus]|uniref:Delta 8-(E)-sphingolipid desaturase n=1 Tax=Elasticomyces elasticus TaxID=574655 RepID=A0AAN7VNE9_9PEZI|nr:hypothetical protein LTR97_010363 [Elasticomyces elasticus]
MGRSCLYTRSDIFALIAAGGVIVIKDDAVLRLDGWMEKHPGGRLAISHMVGRDATDELNISHSPDTVKGMNRFRIGTLTGNWSNFVPPIQGGVFSLTEAENDPKPTALDNINPITSTAEAKANGGIAGAAPPAWSEKELSPLLQAPKTQTPDEFYTQAVQDDINESLNNYPSLDAETQGAITKKYQALHELVKSEGLYDCDYRRYGIEMIRYAGLFAGFVILLRLGWYASSAVFLGTFWQQIMFTAHDAGHRGITHNFVIDTLIGIFIGDFWCGLSIGWWKSSHNVHHLVTNSPEHDPDIQNIPLFATSPEFLKSISSSYYGGFVFVYDAVADFTLKFQSYTYYPIMAFARFNLHFLSWLHLLQPSRPSMGRVWWTRPAEIISIFGYFAWYGYLVCYLCIPTWRERAIFIIVSYFCTLPLHVQITLSHWGMPTCVLPGECFAQHQLRTTMDVDCPTWLDFFHGGLQFQAVHHLFPRMPRHNLRKAQPLVRDFCKDTGIKYTILGFTDGNKKVLSKLDEITKQAGLLAKCQAHMAATGESGLH